MRAVGLYRGVAGPGAHHKPEELHGSSGSSSGSSAGADHHARRHPARFPERPAQGLRLQTLRLAGIPEKILENLSTFRSHNFHFFVVWVVSRLFPTLDSYNICCKNV